MRTRLILALLSTMVLAATVVTPGNAQAAATSLQTCVNARGTIEAVDFSHWGGPIVRGCAAHQHSGFALLHAAGFATAGDAHDGETYICRLGDRAYQRGTQYPTPSEDACINTPPADAYWSYWLAEPSQNHWIYSPLGPLDDTPQPGEIELWTFGSTNASATSGSGVPQFTPAQIRDPSTIHVPDSAVISAEATHLSTSSDSATGLVAGIVIAALLLAAAGWTNVRRRRPQ